MTAPSPDWPRLAFLVADWAWFALGAACLGAAAVAARRPDWLEAADAALGKQEGRPFWRRPVVAALGAGPAALVILYYAATWASYRFGQDAAIMGNLLWNFAHGRGWVSSVMSGREYFSVHFSFSLAVLAPLLWVWPQTLAPILGSGVILGTIPLACYLLGRRLGLRPSASLALAALALGHPAFRRIVVNGFDNSVLAPAFFLWGMLCWTSGFKKTALAFAFLLLACREQAPFLVGGLAAAEWLQAAQARRRRAALLAAAAAACVWFAELAVVQHAGRGWRTDGVNYWTLFGALGGSRQAVLENALARPWLFFWTLVHPAGKLLAPAALLLSLALLPLAAGAQLLPALAVMLPQQLADPSPFQRFEGHYAAFAAGPLLWAAALGLRRVFLELRPGAARRGLAAGLWLVCAFNFLRAPSFMPPAQDLLVLQPWRASAPRALGTIPAQAKVWSDFDLSVRLAGRRCLRSLPVRSGDGNFTDRLFVPDRIVVTKRWLKISDPEIVGQVLGFAKSRRFSAVYQDDAMLVLANPATQGLDSEPVVALSWPPALGAPGAAPALSAAARAR